MIKPENSPGQTGPVDTRLHRFNSTPRVFNLTPDELEMNAQVGAMAVDAYWGVEGKPGMIHRLPRFHIDIPNGKVLVAGAERRPDEHTLIMETGGVDPIADYYGKELVIKGLRQELISPELARMIAQFKAIEDYLPDYMSSAEELFRGNEGITHSYQQWGNEEKNHSKVAELILLNTLSSKGVIGHATQRELRERRQRMLQNGWPLPFPTGREIVAYAVFQELMTRDAYKKLSDRAKEEGAPITSDLLLLVSGDEAYHGGGYMKFLRLYYEQDPVGTLQDTLNVAREFQMPATNLVTEDKIAIQDAIDLGVYGGDYGKVTIKKALLNLGFKVKVNGIEIDAINEELAEDVASVPAERTRRMVNIFERRMQRTKTGLLVPEREVDPSQ